MLRPPRPRRPAGHAPVITPIQLLLLASMSLAWAGFDAFRKQLAGRVGPIALVTAFHLAQVPMLIAWVYAAEPGMSIGPGYVVPGLINLAFNVVSQVMFVQSVRLSPISATVPLLSLTPVFAALIAVVVHDEIPGPLAWLGVVLVVAGALILNLRRGDRTPLAMLRSLAAEPGALWMLGVAACWSIQPSTDKLCLAHSTTGLHVLVQIWALVIVLLVVQAARGRFRETLLPARIAPWSLLAGSVVAMIAALSQLTLLAIHVEIRLVEAFKRAAGLVLALATGRIFFAEPITRTRVLAVITLAVGVLLIILTRDPVTP
jgi:drug/metabolite transporter (DMT)-like permease